jgi:hypothetical protein
LVSAFLCGLSPGIFGKGKKDTEEKPPLNAEWVLCVTAFDVSSLPPSQRATGEMMARGLVDALNSVDYRIRISREYAYYEEYAWSKNRSGAGRTLAEKRSERDLLVYRGNPDWKYRREIKALDEEIVELETAYRETEADIPGIVREPVFTLTQENNEGGFPEAPGAGKEFRFCMDRKADAFLTGVVSGYHGRIFLSLRMYALYTRSFFYEDSTIFSPEDITAAMDEVAGRLAAAVSGTAPAAVAVRAKPEDSIILINESFAGRGETLVIERLPGPVEVRVFTDNHETASVKTDLIAGELAELYVDLKPLALEALTVTAPGALGAAVYRGSLYIGGSPVTLDIPADKYEYFYIETGEGDSAAMVYAGRDGTALLEPRPPREKEVEFFRRKFYGAYGRFWIALPITFLLSGISTAKSAAYNYGGGNPDFYDEAIHNYYISIAAMVITGCVLAETVYRVYRYTRASTASVTAAGGNGENRERGR